MLTSFDSIEKRDRIMVALDCDASRAVELATMLAGHAKWLKVGMTLYYQEGPLIVAGLKARGFKVFLDLKFHDIPFQVRGAAQAAAEYGADMLTTHAVGGADMMRAMAEGAAQGAANIHAAPPVTLGITVLTSMDQKALAETGVTRPVDQQVVTLAKQARQAGLSGVVASAREARELRQALGDDAYIVTPGIRPAGSDVGDQKRIATPQQAFEAGASHLVIGRPITQAADPVQAFEDIVKGL